ncbi:dienelactone hydrolase family protein [Sphingomonas sp.]|uniref:dienelactone hydrolase family protein n=1 Tax=Sphingomonas sp. TaxID=28214 RepID=UPI0025E2FB00|nr:dienelactone hydrolase family protein [Sphingomonas sp.]
MDGDRLQQAIELYDRFTHEGMDRRDFFARMTLIAGSAAAATSLIAAIAASPAAATIVPPDDSRLFTRTGSLGKAGLNGYVAIRKGPRKAPVVMVIHENRGLNPHIEDVARRIALEGFIAVAPDLLTSQGGTPANEDQAREMIGKVDLGAAVAAAITTGIEQAHLPRANGRWGIVGFCWGGAFVDRVAVAAGSKLDAGVSYYGPAPNPPEAVRVEAPLLLHHAGLDDRVAQSLFPFVTALREANKKVIFQVYDGANHAFNNDTSAERYNKAAADLAWRRTIRFFHKYLG